MKGTEGNGDRLGTVSVPQFANFSCDLVERLIPSDLLPFVFAATADTLQRPMDATGALMQFGRLCALNADETLARRMLLIADDIRYAIIPDMNKDAALL